LISGSYDSVKRYVRKLNKKDPKLYARIETLPGVEPQVDFGQGDHSQEWPLCKSLAVCHDDVK